jgi:hypothetical protein
MGMRINKKKVSMVMKRREGSLGEIVVERRV